jgi:hypothetical protein
MSDIALCYFSRLSEGVEGADVRSIVRVSARRNRAAGITGCLVADGGFFAQVLEGPDAAVRECFERIARDPRHRDVRVVWLEPIEARAFPDWSMGGLALDDVVAVDDATVRSLRRDLHRFMDVTADGSQSQYPEFFRHCVACLRDRVLPERIVIEPPSFLRAG